MTTIGVLSATNFSDLGFGGITNFVREVGSELDPVHRAVYFTAGSAVGSLPRPIDTSVSVDIHSRSPRPLNLRYLNGLRAVAEQLSECDVLVAHRPEYAVAVPRRVPLTLVLHGGSYNAMRTGRTIFGLAYLAAETCAAIRSRRVISVDRTSTWLPTRVAAGFAIENTRAPVRSEFLDKERAIGPTDHLITAARLAPEKNIELIIELAARSSLPLKIFGDGPELKPLQLVASSIGADVTFCGTATAQELVDAYRTGFPLFVISSKFEGYPLSVAEALSAGIPVLSIGSGAGTQLVPFGLHRSPSVQRAAEDISEGLIGSPRVRAAREFHATAAVGRKFWQDVLSVLA